MHGSAARGAALLTAIGLLGAIVISVATVAAMATRLVSGAEGVRILGLASIATAVVFAGARALEQRASREHLQRDSAPPAS